MDWGGAASKYFKGELHSSCDQMPVYNLELNLEEAQPFGEKYEIVDM